MIRPAITLILLLLTIPSESWAQACCTGTGAGEFGVVGRCRQGNIAAQLSFTRAQDSYDAEGTRHELEGVEVDDLVMSVAAGWRLTKFWQIYGSAPLRIQHRSFEGLDADTATGLGDVSLGTRYTLVEDPMLGLAESWLPFFDVYASAGLPTGRAPEDAELLTSADVMGTGNYTFSAGTRITKFLTLSDVIAVSGTYSVRPERDIELPTRTRAYAPGDIVDAHLMYLRVFNLWWSAGAHITGQWTGDATEDGQTLTDSGANRYRLGAHVTHAIQLPYWEVTAAVWTDAWWSGAVVNQPFAGPTGSITVQRNFL